MTGGTKATISWNVWKASQKYPIIPLGTGLMYGALFGHLFTQMACGD